jgi:hypothetical protein
MPRAAPVMIATFPETPSSMLLIPNLETSHSGIPTDAPTSQVQS